MNTEVPAVTYANEGLQVNARYVDTITHISQHVKENVEAYALTQAEIKRLRAVYVRTATTDRAAEIMRAQNAVTLVGPRGCGRRITGVAVITELGATPHRIDLDPGDTRRELPADPGCGYIVDIDEQAVRDIPALSELLTRYGEHLAAVNAYLVITTAEEVWNLLELRNRIASVSVRPPSPIDVFRSHLEHVRPSAAGHWTGHPEVLNILDGVSPADSTRLASLADAVLSSGSERDPVQEATAAYKNWSDELKTWFATNENGYHRALLIAAAALNEADAATVFVAANQLSRLVELPRDPGGGLVGNGVAKLLGQIGAEETKDGRIRLPRPAYATSVLDHVWLDRPHLRADLARWLIGIPGTPGIPSADYAGYSLIELAIRQGDATLITHAAGTWAERPGCRTLAATALAEAGVSGRIGRKIRQKMYMWATRATTSRSLQLTIADVCGGPLGKNFPRNAMTRLRHLADHGDPEVHGRVAEAMRALAEEPDLRSSTLREVVRWTTDTGRLRAPGIRTFLTLAEAATDLIPRIPADSERIDLLAAGWRAAFHDPEHVAEARAACLGWLESVAQGTAPRDVIVAILAHTCQDSYDIGLLSPAVWQWARTDEQPAPIPRSEICTELLQKLADRDPLAPGVSAATLYHVTMEKGA